MDFTIDIYRDLLKALLQQNYSFQTFDSFLKEPLERVVMLRHDVDARPGNSLRFAQIQNELGIRGVYYFRAVPQSWDVRIIKEIRDLGHEIGYHYETMDTANGDIDKAWEEFQLHLTELRKLAPVSTICMHGSPLSKYDNKAVWKKYDYKELGLIGEPYFDIDFQKVFYLTDTGRRWDGGKVSVRDKVDSSFDLTFHTTSELIEGLNEDKLPPQIMMNFHPQRWHDSNILWLQEYFVQNAKNLIKRYFYVKNK